MYAREKGSIMVLGLLRCFQAGVLLLTHNKLTYHINVKYTLKFPPQFDLFVLLISDSFPETMNLFSVHYDMSSVPCDMTYVHYDMSSVHHDMLARSYTMLYSVSLQNHRTHCYNISDRIRKNFSINRKSG